jgi:methionine aminopeptidase
MRIATLLTLLALALAGTAVGCGDDDEPAGGTATATQAAEPSPAELRQEIAQVRAMMARAVREYRAGNAAAADRTLGDAYLEHFEKVEHPLEERDHDLMEKIEHALATDIRAEIKKGVPVAAVERRVAVVNRDLDRAEALLSK